MSQQTDAAERFYAAINRNDLDAITADFDPDIVRTEPPDFPTAGTYRGVAAVEANVRKGRGTWAEGRCDPEGYFENGDRVVVYLHAHVRLHNATEWIGGRFADGFVFRDGRIVEYHSFGERADAMRWAGL
jgi:ketosteroid isomerase-like protein